MPEVRWTPVAEEDLAEILFHVAFVDRRPATGERIFREIHDRVTRHAQAILPGGRHPATPPDWRYLRHKRWLVFYRRQKTGLGVLRVVDAVRDLPRLFREE